MLKQKDEGEFILPSLSVNEIEKLPDVGNKIKISFTDRQVAFELSVEKGRQHRIPKFHLLDFKSR